MNRQSGTATRGRMLSRRSMLMGILVGLTAFGFMLSILKEHRVYDHSLALVQEHEVFSAARRANVQGNNDNQDYSSPTRKLEQTIEEEFLEMKRQQSERDELNRKAQEELKAKPREEREFPYPLSCPGTDLKSPSERNYTITLAYHVGMLKNYKSIVTDQMETLDQCGLGKAASEFILSYSGGELEDMQNLTRPYNLFVNNDDKPTTIVHSTKAPWEGPVMNQIADYCRARTVENVISDKPTIVFYFHNKGASKWARGWQQAMDQPFSYSRSLYWRKYMEYFLLERPELCIDQIVNKGAGSCGIMFNRNHYSGNFWAANCDYLRQLSPIDMNVKQDYVKAELWIGDMRGPEDGRRPYSLHQNPATTGLYRHLIEPSEYSLQALQGDTSTATKV